MISFRELVFVGDGHRCPWLRRLESRNGFVQVWQMPAALATISRCSRRLSSPTTRPRVAARTPPEAFFVGSAVFHYLGPAFAVLLFALVEPLGVAWLRIVTAAVVFALWRKPWRVLHTRSTEPVSRTVVAMGVVLAVMNACFYIAIDRLPLGTVAAIEFLPVIALAAVGMRTARNAVALARPSPVSIC